MTTDWLLRVSNGENLVRSSKHRIWGVRSTPNGNKHFIKHVKPGDRLWFVNCDSDGKLLAVVTYLSHNVRTGLTMSNEELGWTREGADWDTEIHYTDLYRLRDCGLLTHIIGQVVIRKYNEKCKVNLAVEYISIERYCNVALEL